MPATGSLERGPAVLGLAVALGVAVAAVDNFALEGEVSPIVVVVLLLVAGGIVGALGSRHAWPMALAVWIWVPLAHAIKHALGMPDTLHPNTYASIMKLGAFTLVVALIGTACGVLFWRLGGGRAIVSPKID